MKGQGLERDGGTMIGWNVARTGWTGTRRAVVLLFAIGLGLLACGGHAADTDSSSSNVSAEVQEGVMSRWNAVARGIVISEGFHFEWTEFEKFPHPTFKSGSTEAYQTFASILVAFYEAGDNFDYLAQNRLFR